MSALVPALLAIVTLSLLMVHAMVRFSRVMITRAERRALRWGIAYALLWAALIAAFLCLMEATGEELTRKNLLLLAGIPTAWVFVDAVLIVCSCPSVAAVAVRCRGGVLRLLTRSHLTRRMITTFEAE